MNRAILFDLARKSVFGGRLSETQVDGLTRILDYRDDKWPSMPDNELAYLLATAKWETASTMQPVTEYGSQKYLRSKKYWPWIGRGLVQITWEANYKKYGIDKPEKALEWPTALHVIFHGMIYGEFTGKRLSDYVRGTQADYVGARKIINGTDKAHAIAGIAQSFRAALDAARDATMEDVAQAPDKPSTGKSIAKSSTAGGALIGGAAGTLPAVVEVTKQASEAAKSGLSLSQSLMAIGPWVLLAVICIGAAAYIIYERRRHAKENGI